MVCVAVVVTEAMEPIAPWSRAGGRQRVVERHPRGAIRGATVQLDAALYQQLFGT